MRASSLLTVAAEGNSVVISGNYVEDSSILFVGASCPASATQFTCGLATVQLSIPPGENALVAMEVRHRITLSKGGTNYNDYQFIIPIIRKDGKLYVKLDELFVPPADRLLQIDSVPDISVTRGGQIFTTCRDRGSDMVKKRETCLSAGKRIVNDPGLLLRFVLGQATLEDLEAAATEDQRTLTERSLSKCRLELEAVKREMEASKSLASQLGRLLDGDDENRRLAEAALSESLVKLKRTESALSACQTELASVERENKLNQTAIHRQNTYMRELVEILDNRGDHNTLFGFLDHAKLSKVESFLRPTREEMEREQIEEFASNKK